MAYCLRCARYRGSDEFFLEQLEQGQHCTAEDCSYCFRRGVRWCWYCVSEEMETAPGKVTPAVQREAAAQGEASSLVRWLWFILDERLHAALARPMHAAWGQPHFCAALPAEAAAASEHVLAELAEAHRRLAQENLFGALEPLPWRAPLGQATLRRAGADREPHLRQPRGARAAAAAAVR